MGILEKRLSEEKVLLVSSCADFVIIQSPYHMKGKAVVVFLDVFSHAPCCSMSVFSSASPFCSLPLQHLGWCQLKPLFSSHTQFTVDPSGGSGSSNGFISYCDYMIQSQIWNRLKDCMSRSNTIFIFGIGTREPCGLCNSFTDLIFSVNPLICTSAQQKFNELLSVPFC